MVSVPSAVLSSTTVIVAVAEEAPSAIVIAVAFIVQSSPESAVESPFAFVAVPLIAIVTGVAAEAVTLLSNSTI